ncbi:hypothetical protein FHT78_001219 [Rhizobium sp. BK196]|nr:hypothetical protein [Rhizobium sp. BK196]
MFKRRGLNGLSLVPLARRLLALGLALPLISLREVLVLR